MNKLEQKSVYIMNKTQQTNKTSKLSKLSLPHTITPPPPLPLSYSSYFPSMGACISSNAADERKAGVLPAAGGGLLRTDSLRALSKRWSSRRWRKRDAKNEREVGRVVDLRLLSKGGSFGDEELQRVTGRMFANGSSSVACLYTQQGKKGTNQDAMIVWENFAARNDTIFCGVFDGHGPFGHLVAKKVRDSLPIKIFSHWGTNSDDQGIMNDTSSFNGSMNSDDTASINLDDEFLDIEENEKLPDVYLSLKQAFLRAFRLMDKELKLHSSIDCFCSGSTAVTFVKQGQNLVIGNVGDSRGVLGTRDKDNILVAMQLTVDLKPNLPREAARIQQCKGRVFALQDEPEVARVWLPNNDSPGLAMARAFGDFCLKDFGLISVPDISYHRITSRDEFVVLATDGVWDVFSNKEVVDIVASAPSRATAARALVDSAVRAWRLKYPTSKIDDCAVVCLFFDHPSTSDEAQEFISDLAKEDARVSGSDVEQVVHDKAQQSSAVDQFMTEASGPDEIVPACEERDAKRPERSQSTRSLAECIFSPEDEEWSALEGVTRVNSLVNLPRFGPADKKSSRWRKWL